MRTAGRMLMGAGGLLSFLVACVGGPGSGGSPSNRSGQNGAVEPDRSQSSVNDPDREDDDDREEGTSNGKGASPPNTQRISAAEFGRGCSTDSDCVAVFEGLVCTVCKCESAAIAKSDQTRYDTERAKRSVGCTQDADPCQPCTPVRVGCDPTSKQCAVGVTSNDAG